MADVYAILMDIVRSRDLADRADAEGSLSITTTSAASPDTPAAPAAAAA